MKVIIIMNNMAKIMANNSNNNGVMNGSMAMAKKAA
jgi:hypothetical protein